MSAPKVVAKWNRRLEQQLRTLGNVSSPEMIGAARVLAKSIRKTLGGTGDGAYQGPLLPGQQGLGRAPSRPGQPPVKQTGALAKSVKRGAVGAAQRVAVIQFYAPFLEFGIDTEADAKAGTVRNRRDLFSGRAREVLAASARRQERRQRQRLRGGNRVKRLVIEPRPFMQRALAAVRGELVDVTVNQIRRRLPSA